MDFKNIDYTVPAVDRAIQVIEILANTDRGISLAELARQLDVPKSSLFRILVTLEEKGILRQDRERKLFRLGMKLLDWGNAALERIDLKTVAHPHLLKIANETKESFYLAILDELEVILIDRADSPEIWRMVARLGQRSPIHATATGQVLISDLGSEALDKILSRIELKKYTTKTLTSVSRLKARLGEVRQTGYAIADKEYKPDLCAIAVPIFDHRSRIVASLMTALPSDRAAKEKNTISNLVDVLKREANVLSRELGFEVDKRAQ